MLGKITVMGKLTTLVLYPGWAITITHTIKVIEDFKVTSSVLYPLHQQRWIATYLSNSNTCKFSSVRQALEWDYKMSQSPRFKSHMFISTLRMLYCSPIGKWQTPKVPLWRFGVCARSQSHTFRPHPAENRRSLWVHPLESHTVLHKQKWMLNIFQCNTCQVSSVRKCHQSDHYKIPSQSPRFNSVQNTPLEVDVCWHLFFSSLCKYLAIPTHYYPFRNLLHYAKPIQWISIGENVALLMQSMIHTGSLLNLAWQLAIKMRHPGSGQWLSPFHKWQLTHPTFQNLVHCWSMRDWQAGSWYHTGILSCLKICFRGQFSRTMKRTFFCGQELRDLCAVLGAWELERNICYQAQLW